MQASTINGTAERALGAALGSADDEASIDARVKAFVASDAVFADKYPTLLRMCCGATTAARQQAVRHFLPLMLQQLGRVRRSPDGADVMQEASTAVGQAVGDRYLPKAEDLAAAASAGADGAAGDNNKRARGKTDGDKGGSRKR